MVTDRPQLQHLELNWYIDIKTHKNTIYIIRGSGVARI